ncbi:hypothetical protein CDAR_514161 [Caerostris darwini]|uniref:Uncharacterized protein n=1 Tax=Caerostris darwini TaxID=1538125 RepID=A0AAV4UNI9_9ARAC|nr:hypothetical protein CDAR_514161 [Caerostris darwini]
MISQLTVNAFVPSRIVQEASGYKLAINSLVDYEIFDMSRPLGQRGGLFNCVHRSVFCLDCFSSLFPVHNLFPGGWHPQRCADDFPASVILIPNKWN